MILQLKRRVKEPQAAKGRGMVLSCNKRYRAKLAPYIYYSHGNLHGSTTPLYCEVATRSNKAG